LYFSSKEDLFKAVVRESIIPLIGEAEGMIGEFEGTSEELFRTMMTTWWQNMGMTKLSGLPKLMMAEAGNFPELARFYQEEVVNRGERLVATMLERGVQRGEIRSFDLEVDARLLIAPMMMMMMWKHSAGVCMVEEHKLNDYLERYIDLAMHGLMIRK